MLISSKLHEIHPPSASDFSYISDQTYTRGRIIDFELDVCAELSFELNGVTSIEWLDALFRVVNASEREVNIVNYLVDLTILDATLRYSPLTTASAAVYTARCMEGRKNPWTAELEKFTGLSRFDFEDCVRRINRIHVGAETAKLKSVYNKYKDKKLGEVSFRVPVEGERLIVG